MLFSNRKLFVLHSALILALAAGMFGIRSVQASAAIRVKWNATGTNNGSSWENAYTDLQTAFSVALSGDEIWVAAGTYKPTSGTDRTVSFALKDGVAVYGGFAGTETARDLRNPSVNLTILSGDIDNNDDSNNADGNFINETYADIVGSNSYHVVTGANRATLDGFTITAGYSLTFPSVPRGGGMYNYYSSPTVTNVTFSGNSTDIHGGGMGNYYSNPTVTNVTFSGNSAGTYGGGMNNYYSNPTLTNVTFSGNKANHGGGMYNDNSSPSVTSVTFSNNLAYYGGGMENTTSSPTVTNVTFNSNSATTYGGGMYNQNLSSPTVTNVIFIANLANNSGGGMYNYQSGSNPIVTNVTFSNNSATYNGGGMYNEGSSTVTNATFSGNSAQQGGGMYNYWSGTIITNVTFSSNSVTNSGGGMYNFESSPTVTNVTFSSNSATNSGGGMYSYQAYNNDNGRPKLQNVIIANSVGGDCALASSSTLNAISSNNLIENNGANACGLTDGANGNIIGSDPLLGTLGNYGGSTQTLPLLPGSFAINAGTDSVRICDSNASDNFDQRGVTRPQGAACDIGAYEYQATTISPGDTVRVSVDSNGGQADGVSYAPSISADGRYIAFNSDATNLIPNDTNGMSDVFVRDMLTGVMTRVSVNSNGVQGDGYSYYPSISADGRYLVFHSSATNLVSDDSNGMNDVFVHDIQTGVTRRVSVSSGGAQANGGSDDASLSADGRYIAFSSSASNLMSGDTNGAADIFVHDTQTGVTTCISTDSNGGQANDISFNASLSADGRYVAFQSLATNLVSGDTNGTYDIFVRDTQIGVTTRVSVNSNGVQGNDTSAYPFISADGRYIAFDSGSTNLVSGDINATFDIFVRDIQTGITTRVSVDSSGMQANDYSFVPFISGDGRFVAFHSAASNLVANDTNGVPEIFVHDTQTGMTTRISVDSNGLQANDYSNGLHISADGRYIAFDSAATNLVPGDTNSQWDVFVHRQEILPIPPTPTPTYTPTYTPTSTPTPTFTQPVSPTPLTNCNQIAAGPLTMSGNSMSMNITNPLTLPIQIQDVFVVWNHDTGHQIGSDKTLTLNSVSLGSQFWSGASNGPSLTIIPSPAAYIPTGTSTMMFTFHQTYEFFDGTEQVFINLATNGCQSYPIFSSSIPTNTPTLTPTNTPTATFTPTSTFTVTSTPPYSYNPLYLSLSSNQTIGGVSFADEDILKFDGTSWSLFFDGSDVGVGSSDLFGFSIVDSNTILMAFSSAVTVNGLTFNPQDVVRFESTSLGTNTAGAFHMYLDGSAVGLDTTAEKLDAVGLLPDGRVLVSTTGNPAVTGVSGGRDEDVLAFNPTTGTWAMYFDGSDVGLGETSGEDVDALDVDLINGKVYLSTADNFSVNGVTGADEDVFVCNSFAPGEATSCSYSSALYFDGSTWALTANDVDAFHFLTLGPVPTNTPTHAPTATKTPTATFTPSNTPTRTPTTTITPTLPRGVFVVQILSHEPHPSNPGEEVTVAVSVSDIGGGPVGNVTVNIVSDEGHTSCITVDMGNSSVCSSVLKFNNPFGHLIRASVGGDYADVDHYVNPASTNTPTATQSATATFTPTNTPNASDLIFKDGFEAGSLAAWTSNTNDLGDLSASPSAALVGTQGLQAVIDDANTIYVTDDTPNVEPRYRARFYFDPNSITMASGDTHFILKGFMGTSTDVLQVEFRNSAGAYQIRAKLLNDASAFVVTSWFNITDAPHAIEVDWRASTGAGANNGGLTLWIDGVQQQALTGVDNDTSRIDRVRLGALAGMDAGTSGTYYFDAFESRRQNYIGP